MFSSIPGLYLPVASSITTTSCSCAKQKNVSTHCHIFPGGQNCPQVRTTDLVQTPTRCWNVLLWYHYWAIANYVLSQHILEHSGDRKPSVGWETYSYFLRTFLLYLWKIGWDSSEINPVSTDKHLPNFLLQLQNT